MIESARSASIYIQHKSRCPHFFLCLVLLSVSFQHIHRRNWEVQSTFSYRASVLQQAEMNKAICKYVYLEFATYFTLRYYHSPYKMANGFPFNSAVKNHNFRDVFLHAKLTSNSAFDRVKIKYIIGQRF